MTIHTPQDTGERLARIETKVEHISVSQDTLGRDHAAAKHHAELTFAEIKESFFQLRLNGETMLKMLDAAHKRIDSVDADLRSIQADVGKVRNEVNEFKTQFKLILTIGGSALTVFWAVFGSSVQGFLGRLFGH